MEMFPDVEPWDSGYLPVSETHTLYYEQYGNPDGIPIVCLHGGPGGAISKLLVRCIDPTLYRIIAFDQRGCGNSTPFGCTDENTTSHLIEDIERLREHLEIERWVVIGRSWGTTLALAYAIEHADRVSALVPVSVFLGRQRDIDWIYQDGASAIYPDEWQNYIGPVPENERHDILGFYRRKLQEGDQAERYEAAARLAVWELSMLWLRRGARYEDMLADESGNVATGILETHYLSQGCFFRSDNWILDNAHRLAGIPGVIIHGRYDVNCRVEQAWLLQQQWPVQLHIAENSGHAQDHPGLIDATISALQQVAPRALH